MDLVKTYNHGQITFELTSQRIIVRTALGQSFSLQPSVHYYKKSLIKVRTLIELDKIHSLQELAHHTNGVIDWVAYRGESVV